MGDAKAILVTGAGSGIGRAVALRLAAPGVSLALLDRDAAAGEACAEEAHRLGADPLVLPADIADPDAVAAAFGRMLDRFGRLDRSIHSAGLGGGDRDPWDAALWERLWQVNVRGTMLCMQHAIETMLAQGGGAIVNIASIAGLVGVGHPAYCASKHAVVGLTRSCAVRYAPHGIRINAICPGTIETPMIDNAKEGRPGFRAELAARHPIGRLGTAEELADAVAWLSSPGARFVVGQAIAVDGGFTAV